MVNRRLLLLGGGLIVSTLLIVHYLPAGNAITSAVVGTLSMVHLAVGYNAKTCADCSLQEPPFVPDQYFPEVLVDIDDFYWHIGEYGLTDTFLEYKEETSKHTPDPSVFPQKQPEEEGKWKLLVADTCDRSAVGGWCTMEDRQLYKLDNLPFDVVLTQPDPELRTGSSGGMYELVGKIPQGQYRIRRTQHGDGFNSQGRGEKYPGKMGQTYAEDLGALDDGWGGVSYGAAYGNMGSPSVFVRAGSEGSEALEIIEGYRYGLDMMRASHRPHKSKSLEAYFVVDSQGISRTALDEKEGFPYMDPLIRDAWPYGFQCQMGDSRACMDVICALEKAGISGYYEFADPWRLENTASWLPGLGRHWKLWTAADGSTPDGSLITERALSDYISANLYNAYGQARSTFSTASEAECQNPESSRPCIDWATEHPDIAFGDYVEVYDTTDESTKLFYAYDTIGPQQIYWNWIVDFSLDAMSFQKLSEATGYGYVRGDDPFGPGSCGDISGTAEKKQLNFAPPTIGSKEALASDLAEMKSRKTVP